MKNLGLAGWLGARRMPRSLVAVMFVAIVGATLVDIHGALLPEVNTYIGVDGLHPNEAGYRKIAETFMATIQATLEVR